MPTATRARRSYTSAVLLAVALFACGGGPSSTAASSASTSSTTSTTSTTSTSTSTTTPASMTASSVPETTVPATTEPPPTEPPPTEPPPTEPPTTPPPTTAPPSTASITVVDFGFNPKSMNISSATTVVVTNTGTFSHTFTADNGAFPECTLGSGQQCTRSFSPGTYGFHCRFHASMTGTLTVS